MDKTKKQINTDILRELREKNNEDNSLKSHSFFGDDEVFPGIKFEISKLKNIGDFEYILEIEFEEWMNITSKMPNCEEDKNLLIKEQEEFHNEMINFIPNDNTKNPLTFDTFSSRRKKIKDIPNDYRKQVQYKTKQRLKQMIIDEKNTDIKLVLGQYLNKVCELIDPHELKLNRSSIEKDDIRLKLERRQKMALLESVGAIDFLLNETFKGNQKQTAKFLSLLIDCDQQNIRGDINADTEILLTNTKITDVINPILTDLGLKSKE